MSQGKITDKQREILEYIKEMILKKGYPPTVREICEKVQLKSTSSVHSHLEQLEKNGYIHRDPTKPRAIEIVDDTFNLSRRELVNVPLIGTVAAGAPILADENVENYFPIPAGIGNGAAADNSKNASEARLCKRFGTAAIRSPPTRRCGRTCTPTPPWSAAAWPAF